MSAAVCQKRHFDDLHGSPTPLSTPLSKRRCSGNSPVRFASSPGFSRGISDQLKALFPEMDEQYVEKVLEDCGNNLDDAIKCLNELRLSNERPATSYSQSVPAPPTSEGMEWVELFVREMLSATDLTDARARATRALESFEKTVSARNSEALLLVQKENETLKNQLQTLVKDNTILKRGVAIQHERYTVESEERSKELKHLKQVVAQCQEELRSSEMKNFALSMHLRRAQEHTSMPGRFHPDVF